MFLKLKEFRENPLAYTKKLTNPRPGSFRFKIGDYRVIFDLDDKLIVLLHVGHQKSIYQ
ncbi:MAG: type II toxin-antitoxin system RelE family toxin [Candidatus Heimdallarchaeota archaeon]